MWKTIEFENNYEVSDDGKVRNKFSKIIKNLRKNRDGYFRVTLYPSGKTYTVHRLVALVFLDNPLNEKFVNHLDGCKTNNLVKNLEWCSAKRNVHHAYELGLNVHRNIIGEKNPSAKLDWVKVGEIRKFYSSGDTISDLAKKYNVQYNCIKRIVLNITWKI